MNGTTMRRALAATAALAWLALGVAVATEWPHHHVNAPAESTPTAKTERVCWRDGSAALVTTLPEGHLIAVSDGTCTYTGPAHSSAYDLEANR
jgi:hypothetical protein